MTAGDAPTCQIKITLRHLLTHTSGLAYTTWDPLLAKYRHAKPAPTGLLPLRFDPGTERFERYGFPRAAANVRQIHGRPGEVWLPESGTEHISVIRTAT